MAVFGNDGGTTEKSSICSDRNDWQEVYRRYVFVECLATAFKIINLTTVAGETNVLYSSKKSMGLRFWETDEAHVVLVDPNTRCLLCLGFLLSLGNKAASRSRITSKLDMGSMV